MLQDSVEEVLRGSELLCVYHLSPIPEIPALAFVPLYLFVVLSTYQQEYGKGLQTDTWMDKGTNSLHRMEALSLFPSLR